jgi:lipid A 3-O-deacylase
MRAITTLLGLALAAAVLPASAQSPPAPPPDPAAIWSLQVENAAISTSELADRYYTNGIRLGWTSAEGGAPHFLEWLGQALWGEGQQRIGVDLVQQIYTPAANTVAYPPLTDRPYAGVLMGAVSLIHDGAAARSVLGLGLGLVGPSALGEPVQNGFHTLFGQNHIEGWNTQLHDEPLFQLTGARTWRLPIGTLGGLETDALPEVTVSAGTLRVYGQAGAALRIGQGLDSDYGAARILPGLTGTDVFHPTRPIAWYLFAGVDGQAVASDLTLQGNIWHDSRSVKIIPAVAEMQAGVAVMAYGMRWTYTQVMQTQEFQHQKGGLHQFGSLAMSVRF